MSKQKSFFQKYLPVLFLLSSSLLSIKTSIAQDTCNLRISLLTCSPGEELYSTFGHSALRVTNSVTGEDVVYNYGTFDFAEPGFYMKFIRGKLLYYLSTEDFQNFSETYRQDGRGIIEQVLNLNCSEKEKIASLLRENLLPQNRGYKYDFLFDNCTTRLRDLVEKVAQEKVIYPDVVPDNTRFREVIHLYLDQNHQYWSKFGIDLLLGSNTDKIMTDREAMFLPDYLMTGFDTTKLGGKNLVLGKSVLFNSKMPETTKSIFDQPIFYTGLLFLLIVLLSFSKNETVVSVLRNFDRMFFFLVGVLGIIMTLMWFATDHVMCRNNYNIIWALPTHVVACFYLHSKKQWIEKYLLITISILVLLLVCWIILPQDLNMAIIPLIWIMMFRGFLIIRHHNKLKKQWKKS